MVRSAAKVPSGFFWTVVKNGRMSFERTLTPGGMSLLDARVVVPRMERSALTRDATLLAVNATVTSEVGSWYDTAPPTLTVRSKKVWLDGPDATWMLSSGL